MWPAKVSSVGVLQGGYQAGELGGGVGWVAADLDQRQHLLGEAGDRVAQVDESGLQGTHQAVGLPPGAEPPHDALGPRWILRAERPCCVDGAPPRDRAQIRDEGHAVPGPDRGASSREPGVPVSMSPSFHPGRTAVIEPTANRSNGTTRGRRNGANDPMSSPWSSTTTFLRTQVSENDQPEHRPRRDQNERTDDPAGPEGDDHREDEGESDGDQPRRR